MLLRLLPRHRRHAWFLPFAVAAGAGFLIFQFILPPWPSSSQDHRWKLFGEASMPLRFTGITRQNIEGKKLIAQMAGSLTDLKETARLVQALGALQVSCYNHPENHGVLEKYSVFMRRLALYASFHKGERMRKGARKLIWVCDIHQACGGLADRMKGVSYALLLAMFSDRILLLDWSESEFGEHSFLQTNSIDWKLSQKSDSDKYSNPRSDDNEELDDDEKYEDDSVTLHLFSTLLYYGIDVTRDILKMSLDTIEGDSEWVELATNLELSSLLSDTKTASAQWIREGMVKLGLSHLTSDEMDSLTSLLLRYLFRFSDQLMQEVKNARSVLGLAQRQYVGVHVRTGFAGSLQQETVKHPKLLRSYQLWERSLFCGFRVSLELQGSDGLLFLATDSTLVKNRTLHMYSGRFRTLNNTVLHLDRLEKSPHVPEAMEVEGVLSTWVDFVLLAESFALVRQDSGYAALAGDVCFIPKKYIINDVNCLTQY